MRVWAVWIECDATDCGAQFPDHLGYKTVGSVRDVARRLGWVRRRVGMASIDLCPDHAADNPESVTTDR